MAIRYGASHYKHLPPRPQPCLSLFAAEAPSTSPQAPRSGLTTPSLAPFPTSLPGPARLTTHTTDTAEEKGGVLFSSV